MLFFDHITSRSWHLPQAASAARKSPGLTKRMYSSLSLFQSALVRVGLSVSSGLRSRGRTWAVYLFVVSVGSPPLQSAEPMSSSSSPSKCMDLLRVWQMTHRTFREFFVVCFFFSC